MSAEILDTCNYESNSYDILATDNKIPFTPNKLQIKAQPHPACWRGYYCEYYIIDGKLTLSNLHVHSNGDYPLIKGKMAANNTGGFNNFKLYKALDMPISYTGGIVLADGFLNKFYSNIGVQTPYCFKKVYELIFESGDLVEFYDYSKEMDDLRKKYPDELNDKSKSEFFSEMDEKFKKTYEEF